MANRRSLARAASTVLLASATLLIQQLAAAQSPTASQACPKPALGLTEFAQRVAPDHVLQSGAASDALVREAVETLCEESSTKSALPHTCGSPLLGNALVALRDQLVLDLTAQAEALQNQVANLELRNQLLAAAAIIEMVLSDRSQAAFAAGLARLRSQGHLTDSLCGLGAGLSLDAAPIPPEAEPLARAGRFLLELSNRGTEELEVQRARATQLLSDWRKEQPPVALTPEQEQILTELLQQLQQLRALEAQLRASLQNEALLTNFVLGNLRSLALALKLLDAPPVALPEAELAAIARAFVTGDPQQVLTQLAKLARIEFSMAALQRVERIVALLRAETDEARRRIIRAEVLGSLWPEDVLADAHVGALMLKGDTYKVTGDLLLGYSKRSWGIAARGRLNSYDLSNSNKIDQTDAYGGTLESWLAANPSRGLALEGRLVLGAAYRDTTVSDGIDMLSEESILGRVDALAGARIQRSRIALGVWAGGGLQLDHYTPTLMSGTNDNLIDTSSDTLQGHLVGRLRLQYQLLPDLLALRLAGDGEFYHLTRATVTTTLGDAIQVENSTTSASHVDARTRLYVDVEAARFFEFVPGIAGGFDLVYEKGAERSQTNLAPVLTVGIRRTSF